MVLTCVALTPTTHATLKLLCLSPTKLTLKLTTMHSHASGIASSLRRRSVPFVFDPRLEGSKYGISFAHLQTDYWFDEYHEYKNSAPALAEYDGVLYGHYVGSGNFGSALSTKHHGYSLIEKLACSVTVGHSHKFHYYVKADARPTPLHGLVAGCFKGKEEAWAGQANAEWTKGVAIKRYINNGTYDLQWISLAALEKEYG